MRSAQPSPKPPLRATPSLFLLFLLLLPRPSTVLLSAQEADPRIAAVENGLAGAIRVRGEEPQRFSILDRMAHYSVPGTSIAVLDEGEIAWAKGYGVMDVETGEPVTTETLFQAASISKPVAATAALRLVEEGLLELDAPVNEYLTSWQIPSNRFTQDTPVTLRHLLTHTGGLTVHGFPGYGLDAELATPLEVLDGSGPANTDPVRVDTIPGTLWRYSGGGYTIMQQLLEDVTGTPFPQVLREKVLDPVGMELSSYEQPLPPARARYAASSHLSDGTGGDGKWHLYPEMAAAGLWTNPTELARLAVELRSAYHGRRDRVLSPDMTHAMITPGLGGWGLGFTIRGEGDEARFSHGGSNYGFKAQFLAFKEEGRGAFVMTNGDQGSALAQEIVLAVAEAYGWPVPRPQEVILADVPESILQEIAGPYRIVGQELDLTVTVVDGHLKVEVPEAELVKFFHPTAENFFIDLSDGERIRIDRNEAGEVTAFQSLGGGTRVVRVKR